jgi:hypothetical protein
LKLFINHQLIKIKFTLNKIGNWQQTVAVDNGRNGATEHDPGDRETIPVHQGGAVVPDGGVVTHEIERPETHVKTECKK